MSRISETIDTLNGFADMQEKCILTPEVVDSLLLMQISISLAVIADALERCVGKEGQRMSDLIDRKALQESFGIAFWSGIERSGKEEK